MSDGIAATLEEECPSPEAPTAQALNPSALMSLSRENDDASVETTHSSTALAAHPRVPRLPPLSFQLPQRPRSVLASTSSLPFPDTPTRPLLTRSAGSFTSLTASSFYSSSTSPSRFPQSRPQSTISSTSEYSPYGRLRDSPQRIIVTPSKPEVPPIPERWKQAALGSRQVASLEPRPKLLCVGPGEAASSKSPAAKGSMSWTDISDSTQREPSFYRYPIIPIPHPKLKTTPDRTNKIMDGRIHRRSSYEGLRKGEEDDTIPSEPFSTCTHWLGLDDRRDPKQKKRTVQEKKKRESRTLMKKTQP